MLKKTQNIQGEGPENAVMIKNKKCVPENVLGPLQHFLFSGPESAVRVNKNPRNIQCEGPESAVRVKRNNVFQRMFWDPYSTFCFQDQKVL